MDCTVYLLDKHGIRGLCLNFIGRLSDFYVRHPSYESRCLLLFSRACCASMSISPRVSTQASRSLLRSESPIGEASVSGVVRGLRSNRSSKGHTSWPGGACHTAYASPSTPVARSRLSAWAKQRMISTTRPTSNRAFSRRFLGLEGGLKVPTQRRPLTNVKYTGWQSRQIPCPNRNVDFWRAEGQAQCT